MSGHIQSEALIGPAICIFLIPQRDDCRLRESGYQEEWIYHYVRKLPEYL